MRALSIRQPFAELILRGIKTVEYRSRPTRIIGERFFIYAARGTKARRHEGTEGIWSGDLSTKGDLPEWMIELAGQIKLIPPGLVLPTGVIVGSAVIEKCEEIETERRRERETKCADGLPFTPSLRLCVSSSLSPMYAWHLSDVQRAGSFRKPTNHPQPVWFKPF
jgi:hypothetical protein